MYIPFLSENNHKVELNFNASTWNGQCTLLWLGFSIVRIRVNPYVHA